MRTLVEVKGKCVTIRYLRESCHTDLLNHLMHHQTDYLVIASTVERFGLIRQTSVKCAFPGYRHRRNAHLAQLKPELPCLQA